MISIKVILQNKTAPYFIVVYSVLQIQKIQVKGTNYSGSILSSLQISDDNGFKYKFKMTMIFIMTTLMRINFIIGTSCQVQSAGGKNTYYNIFIGCMQDFASSTIMQKCMKHYMKPSQGLSRAHASRAH